MRFKKIDVEIACKFPEPIIKIVGNYRFQLNIDCKTIRVWEKEKDIDGQEFWKEGKIYSTPVPGFGNMYADYTVYPILKTLIFPEVKE